MQVSAVNLDQNVVPGSLGTWLGPQHGQEIPSLQVTFGEQIFLAEQWKECGAGILPRTPDFRILSFQPLPLCTELDTRLHQTVGKLET